MFGTILTFCSIIICTGLATKDQTSELQRRLYAIYISIHLWFYAKQLYTFSLPNLICTFNADDVNPILAGGSESMYSLGGAQNSPNLEKGLREKV